MCGDLSHIWEAMPEVGQYSVGISVYLVISEMLHQDICEIE